MENFFGTLYQVFATSPWWVQVILALSIGICALSFLAILVCSLFLTPICGTHHSIVLKPILLHTWHAGIVTLIAIFKAFHLPTEGLERGKRAYEEEICKVEGIKHSISNKAKTKEADPPSNPLGKHSYKDIEE
ncbi:hypothetical protein [Fibrobacter sp. UWB11]|uniref:hypothetical protein n=1 Tax=Fibrobacter sp. UWB11 TaxID=1896202 RepID=UPI000925F9E2|nr:hypothetical protein [Fibrobacter sp. UWB11]SIO31314.1 hypothetical protein SAMN05720758_2202 [Fibrobacter sp. UWB11]